MRILFVASDAIPHVGGKSSHVLDLMDGLDAHGVSSDLISFGSLRREFQLMIKARFGMDWLRDRQAFDYKFGVAWARRLDRMVLRQCLRKRYDCISAQDALAASAVVRAAEQTGTPIVLTMHTYFGIESALDGRAALQDSYYKASLHRELEALDAVRSVVAVDERIRRHVEDVAQKRGHVGVRSTIPPVNSVSNFVNLSTYSTPTPEERIAARSRLGLSPTDFAVSCVRRLVEKNGVLEAVRSIPGLPRDFVLLVAGDGPQREIVERAVQELGVSHRVRMLGAVDQETAVDLYAASDASLVPSVTVGGLQEATSISALEAMSCSVPVIASNIGGLAQMIRDGNTGILVEERTPRAITDALLKLREDPVLRFRIGANGRRYVEESHSHVGAAARYVQIFASAAALRAGKNEG